MGWVVHDPAQGRDQADGDRFRGRRSRGLILDDSYTATGWFTNLARRAPGIGRAAGRRSLVRHLGCEPTGSRPGWGPQNSPLAASGPVHIGGGSGDGECRELPCWTKVRQAPADSRRNDRSRLAFERARLKERGWALGSARVLTGQISTRTFQEWDEARPGCEVADLARTPISGDGPWHREPPWPASAERRGLAFVCRRMSVGGPSVGAQLIPCSPGRRDRELIPTALTLRCDGLPRSAANRRQCRRSIVRATSAERLSCV
jgi:hypothetical protein